MSETRDPEFLAITEKEIYEEARDRLKISAEADSKNRPRAKYASLFREGEGHWDSNYVTSASMEQPELVINLTDTLVTRIVNNMAEREPRGKCHPIGEGADVDKADIINGIGRHIEYRSDAEVAYDNGADNAVTMGWGWWGLSSEYMAPDSFQKEIRIDAIMNAFSCYPDPSAIMPTACDMKWFIETYKIKRTEYKRLYPRAENVAFNEVGRDADSADWEDAEEIRLASYFRIREVSDKLHRVRRLNGTEYVRFGSELPKEEAMTASGDHITETRDASRPQVEWFKLNGVKVVDREILPGSWIPRIRCQGNARNIDGEIWRRGMVQSMIDPQRMVDYGEVAKIKRLGLTPQSPWVAAEGQLDGHPEWTASNNEPIPVLTYKPVTVMTGQGEVPLPPPSRQPPAQIESGFSEFVQGMRSNLLAIAGMPNEVGQDQQQGQAISGIAQQRRDKLSDQSHSQYYKNQRLAIAHTWRIMLEWIPHYYSEERMQRIIGEDNKPQMVKLNQKVFENGIQSVKNDLSVGRYDVVMDSGPSYETMREESAESLIELVGSPTLGPIVSKVAPDLVFRAVPGQYNEEIADRLAAQTPEGLKSIMESLPKQARAAVQSLASENQQLKQSLQNLQMEQKYGITKAHMEATVKAHDTETRADTARFDTATRAHTALAVEEIRAGGKILDTHAKAGHDERAADRMIEAGQAAEKPNGA